MADRDCSYRKASPVVVAFERYRSFEIEIDPVISILGILSDSFNPPQKPMEEPVKHLSKIFAASMIMLLLLVILPVSSYAQLSKVKTVWVILMENHNWTGNNAGAAFGAPDIKCNLQGRQFSTNDLSRESA